MDFQVATVPGSRAIRLEGELDMSGMDALQPAVDEAMMAGGPLVVDLTALTFMDSTGINAWAKAGTLLAEGGWCIYLHVNSGIVERVLEMSGIDRLPNLHISRHPGADTPAA